MDIRITEITRNESKLVAELLSENWGSDIIVTRGRVHHAEDLSGFIAWDDEQVAGLITYHI